MLLQTASSVKEEFVRKWIKGLQTYDACKREMSITERKNAIKLSADVAMASTATQWPALWRRWIMTKKSNSKHAVGRVEMKKSRMRCLMKRIRGRRPMGGKRGDYYYYYYNNNKQHKGRRCSAKRVVKKRRAVLKGLIPGGECMEDDKTLIKETLDYIVALRLQVEVMRELASSSATSHQLSAAFGNTTTS